MIFIIEKTKSSKSPALRLRAWECRTGLAEPALTSSVQGLHATDDVLRLALIKPLADLGHAVGSLAALDMPPLLRLPSAQAQALTATHSGGRAAAVATNARRAKAPTAARPGRSARATSATPDTASRAGA